jgi:DNA-binding transcriptional LysR family regulator
MSLQAYGEVGHAVVSAPARSDDLFESFLQRRKIVRRVGLRTPRHLSLPSIIESTDLIATVPIATADRYARLGLVRLAKLPFPPPVFAVQQNWHARTHQEPRMRWFRAQIATLFNDESDPWKAVEMELYGPLRKSPSVPRRQGR